ncbi:hypothetical protein GGX14DRAFT_443310 [Mycena pura]|uniref:MARVEL domain-containing protein n=1 Tax=Mycena pura TaxID=153505 RepID=A0AAD6VNH8_9AGAR|nr:hypothetical protein GGX14DRAFT_443310 [Mycena pura]
MQFKRSRRSIDRVSSLAACQITGRAVTSHVYATHKKMATNELQSIYTSASSMGLPLHTVRLVVLAAVSLFGLVALAMGGALAGAAGPTVVGDTDIAPYASLAIATGVLTLVTLLPMIVLEIIRPGGPTSMIIVEIAWLSILAILWLATGAETAAVLQAVSDFGLGFGGICDSDDDLSDLIGSSAASQISAGCGETKAIAAFGFLNWLLLTFYVVVILIFGIMASSRKQAGVWTSSVSGMQSGAGPAEKNSVPRSYAAYPPVVEPQSTGTGGTVQAGTVHSHV